MTTSIFTSIPDFAFEHETERDIRAYVAVGRALIHWGNIEQNFNSCVYHLYYKLGGAKVVTEPPFALKRKIEFWNKCFNKLEYLSPQKRTALKFSKNLADLKVKRDNIFHFGWDTGEDQSIKGRSTRSGITDAKYETAQIPVKSIQDFTIKVNSLNIWLLPVVPFLFRLKPPK